MTAPAIPIAAPRKSANPLKNKDFRTKLDRCGELLEKYQLHKPWLDELKTLKDEIRQECKTVPTLPTLPIRLEGELFFVDLGKCENERRVTNKAKAFAALRKALGLAKLIEAVTFTFKLLDQHLAPAQQAEFVVQEPTGTRDLSAVRKAPAAA